MTETLALTNMRGLVVALAANLRPTLPEIYEQIVCLRGLGMDQLTVYTQNYVNAMTSHVVDTLASAGAFRTADDDVLAVWDAYCRDRGWLEVDGEHFFPSARIDLPDFRASTDLEPTPAPPSITAADLAEIVSTAVDKVISAIAANQGDVMVQRDKAGAVVGVRRRRATID
jgi:hypothetical protein